MRPSIFLFNNALSCKKNKTPTFVGVLNGNLFFGLAEEAELELRADYVGVAEVKIAGHFAAEVVHPEYGNAELVGDPVRSFDSSFLISCQARLCVAVPLPNRSYGNFVEEHEFDARADTVHKVVVAFGNGIQVDARPFVAGITETERLDCLQERQTRFKIQIGRELRAYVVGIELSGVRGNVNRVAVIVVEEDVAVQASPADVAESVDGGLENRGIDNRRSLSTRGACSLACGGFVFRGICLLYTSPSPRDPKT